MPLYMTQFAYTADAWAALAHNPVNRAEGFRTLTEQQGGRFVDLFYTFGEYDRLVIFEALDDTVAAAIVIAAAAPGHLKAVRTTRLLTVPEAMEAMRKAGAVSYAAPSA